MTKGLSGTPKEWIGRTVEVLTTENKLTFMGKIMDFDGTVLSVEDATGRPTPSVLYNQEIKLRVFKSGGVPVIVYGQICGSTEKFWKLDRLESLPVSEKREHFRHSIFAVARLKRGVGAGSGNISCQVVDVSAGGVLIRCREPFREGEQITLTDLKVVEEMEPFSFSCVVKRIRRDEESGDFLYGCQFEGLGSKEEDRILKAILIDQRNNLKKDRDRYTY